MDWNRWTYQGVLIAQSHPIWVRGLKQLWFTGDEWILRRTLYGCVDWNIYFITTLRGDICRTLYGCVDWNISIRHNILFLNVAPYMGAWIETLLHSVANKAIASRTLYGCVDWNWIVIKRDRDPLVAPYMGAWIETSWQDCWRARCIVAPYMGAWIETLLLRVCRTSWHVAPYMGAWIETLWST